MKEKDYTGQRFGMLVAIRFTGKRHISPSGYSRRIWLLRCDCGKEVERTTISMTQWSNTPQKQIIHCGCQKKSGPESVANEVYKMSYADGDITFDKFLELSQQDCFHCGSKVQDSGAIQVRRSDAEDKRGEISISFQYHGLDRIDHIKPHNIDNVVPSCAPCNFLRGRRTLQQFLLQIVKIYKNYENKSLLETYTVDTLTSMPTSFPYDVTGVK